MLCAKLPEGDRVEGVIIRHRRHRYGFVWHPACPGPAHSRGLFFDWRDVLLPHPHTPIQDGVTAVSFVPQHRGERMRVVATEVCVLERDAAQHVPVSRGIGSQGAATGQATTPADTLTSTLITYSTPIDVFVHHVGRKYHFTDAQTKDILEKCRAYFVDSVELLALFWYEQIGDTGIRETALFYLQKELLEQDIVLGSRCCGSGAHESLPAEELECRGQPELDSDTDSIPSPLPTPETVGSVDEDMRSPPSRGDPEAANGDCPLPPTWPVEFFDRKTGLVMHNPVVLSNGVSYDLETVQEHFHSDGGKSRDRDPLGALLFSGDFFPNVALRELITSFEALQDDFWSQYPPP